MTDQPAPAVPVLRKHARGNRKTTAKPSETNAAHRSVSPAVEAARRLIKHGEEYLGFVEEDDEMIVARAYLSSSGRDGKE